MTKDKKCQVILKEVWHKFEKDNEESLKKAYRFLLLGIPFGTMVRWDKETDSVKMTFVDLDSGNEAKE